MRVIGALMVRDLYTRYGREHLGFLWLMVEPLMITVGVIVLWRLLSGPYMRDLPIVPLTLLGYIPLHLYGQMTSGSMHYMRENSSLLFHRHVTLLDIYLSRVAADIIGNMLAFFTTYYVLYQLGQLRLPADLSLLYLGHFYNAWWAAAATAIIMPLSERSELVQKFWVPISLLQGPISGAYVMAQWVPASWRDYYMLWPSVHGYEMMRAGYFGDNVAQYWSQYYIAFWCALVTLIGLCILRDTRKYIVFG